MALVPLYRKCPQIIKTRISFFQRTFFKFNSTHVLSRSGFNDYERERASFVLNVPEKFNFASDVIDVWAQKEKEGIKSSSIPALWYVSEDGQELKWNYQELETDTKRAANVLQDFCQLGKGDNIIVMLPKVPEFWLINVAAIRTGIVLCPVSMMLTEKDLAYRFSAFKPACIIAHETVVDIIDKVAPNFPSLKVKLMVSESMKSKSGWSDFQSLKASASSEHKHVSTKSDDSMMVFFTSGSTGQPKMVEQSQCYGLHHRGTGKYALDLDSKSIMWNLSDTGWAKTAYNFFACWNHGSSVFVHGFWRFNPTLILDVLSKYPISTFCAPPTAFKALVNEDLSCYKFPHLYHCVTGGETLNPIVLKKWSAATGQKIYECYGQTETVLTIGLYKCLEYKVGSIGKPAPGIDVAILDDNGNELGPGEPGEISLKTTNRKAIGLFKCYKDNPEKTDQSFTNQYYRTGDNAYYDEDGYFWFVGRNDDLINSSGYRIGPAEVESAMLEHPAVLEVAVTSSPDPERGEVVKAFVCLKDEYLNRSKSELIEELQEHTKKITAPYKYPRKIEFVTDFPRTTSGKIQRFELKKREWKKS